MQVYLGSANTSFANPDLSIETARSFYDANLSVKLATGALGDIDNDGKRDFGIGDFPGLGRQTHILRGQDTLVNRVPANNFTDPPISLKSVWRPPLLPGHTTSLQTLDIPVAAC